MNASFSKLAIVVVLMTLPSVAIADVPHLINFQGRLADSLGSPVPDGEYLITFLIYDEDSECLWTSGPNIPVQTTNGLFTVIFGDSAMPALPDSLFAGTSELFLGIYLEGESEMKPRTRLTSVPYAIQAQRADTARSVADQALTNEMISDTTITFDKFASNAGELGHVLAYVEEKEGSFWSPRSLTGMAEEYLGAWTDHGTYVSLFMYSDDVGIGTAPSYVPLAKLHVQETDIGVDVSSPLQQDDLIIEDADAVLGLYSDHSGSVGSAIYLAEIAGGVFWDKWAIYRETSGEGNYLRFTFGTDPNAANNETKMHITPAGRTVCKTLELTGGTDLAEPFLMTESRQLPAGALVIIDDMNPGKLTMSSRPYDTRVAGIVSGAGGINPGITLTQGRLLEDGQNVTISGRAYCLADASSGPIRAGDMLTTSSAPGHAMKATDRDRSYGAVIGKAMTTLDSGKGLVLVLVNLQ